MFRLVDNDLQFNPVTNRLCNFKKPDSPDKASKRSMNKTLARRV